MDDIQPMAGLTLAVVGRGEQRIHGSCPSGLLIDAVTDEGGDDIGRGGQPNDVKPESADQRPSVGLMDGST